MNRTCLIGCALLVVTTVACQGKQKRIGEKVKNASPTYDLSKTQRLEISKPNGESVVLKKRGDHWRISSPIDAAVSDFYSERIQGALKEKISEDVDVILSKEKLKRYDLSDDRAYKVAFFKSEEAKTITEFYVGKEAKTENGEQRSHIKTMDGIPYFAKSNISSIVRAPVNNLRTKIVFRSKEKPTSITITPRNDSASGGEIIKFEFVGNKWEMTAPKKKHFEIDPIQVQQLVDAFTQMKSVGFGDAKTDEEMGLENPHSTVVAKIGDKSVQYEIGNPAKKVFYVRIVGEKSAFKLTKGPGRVLAGDYLIFKNRVEKIVPIDEVISFQLAGKENLKVVKRGNKWFAGTKELDSSKVAPVLGAFARMTAVKWKHEDRKTAGLIQPAGRVIINTKNSSHRFEIGAIFKKDNSRYARWSDSEYIMEIPSYIWDRAKYGLESLKLNEKK